MGSCGLKQGTEEVRRASQSLVGPRVGAVAIWGKGIWRLQDTTVLCSKTGSQGAAVIRYREMGRVGSVLLGESIAEVSTYNLVTFKGTTPRVELGTKPSNHEHLEGHLASKF